MIGPKVPRMAIGDAGKIRQILFNLVGNALKFTEIGGVLVGVTIEGERLVYSVYDTGPGMDIKDQSRLFEAFRQSDASDAHRDGGVGLGLAIVQRLASALGGEVDLSSARGLGTRFHVRLPFQEDTSSTTKPITPTRLKGSITLIGLPAVTTLASATTLQAAGATVRLAPPDTTTPPPGTRLILADASVAESVLRTLCASKPTLVVVRPEDRGLIGRFHDLGAAGWLVRPLRASSLVERAALAMAGTQAPPEDIKDEGSGHVVIADDNPVNALIARRALESAGFSVTVASTGRDALDAVSTMSPDLILMDLRMPIMDGYTAMRALRADGCDVPIIAISAEINPEIERRAIDSGANGVAAKPLDAEALRRLAFEWTARKTRAGTA